MSKIFLSIKYEREFYLFQVLYSTLSSSPSWTHVDFLASSIRISHAFNIIHEDVRSPLLILTVCDYGESI